MSRGLNKAMIIGNVGNVEVRYGSSGDAIATLSIATSENWKDKQSGEKRERVEWHRVVIYGKLAEIVEKYVNKGTKLYIEGSIRTNKWTDNQGQDRYTTEIIARDMQMLDSRGSGAQEEKPAEKGRMPESGLGEDDIPF